ncbi:serine/threonine-protein kinase [Nonomuraea sp. B19D2]|uniref:serine/threonine-protein kinase n=1 Tax=Nonomuraea sp. B19D2 TaxID=3159561 RepID=UPI0032DA727A
MRDGMTVGGRYRQETCLVSSRATEVWLARDLLLNRDVVLKRMLVDNAGFSRLQAEARALAAFNHPHVVTLYDAVQDDDEAASWMVMEHVPGGSLDEHPPMPPEQAARLGAQIAGALAALHAKGIVHLDVKPGNIILTGDGVAKLADFGAAYRVGGRETITPNGAISYTVDYASPEVVTGRPEPASDVFSLGATLYALVAGRPPRPGVDEEESDAYVTAWEAARGAVEMTADVGPLESLLADMLQPDPVERPSAAEVRRRLEKLAGSAPTRPRRLEKLAGSARPRPRRRPFILVGAALVVVVAAYAVYHTVSGLTASSAGPSAGPVAPSAGPPASLIGDPRSADPCALTDPAALRRFGRAELDVDYGNFDRCDVIVLPPTRGVVDVQVWLDRDPPPERAQPARTVGPVEVIDHPAESEVCRRTLLLPGVEDTVVKVIANMEEDGKVDLCAIADAATTTAAQALAAGPIERRSPPLPAASLAQRDACALLRGIAIEAVPGVDATSPDPGFGGWHCSWDGTTGDTWVNLQFDRELRRNTEDDGTPTRVNGYRAFVTPKGEGGGTCLLQVIYRSYADQRGESAVEKVRIVVGGSRPTDRLCRMATDLARSATAQLRGS